MNRYTIFIIGFVLFFMNDALGAIINKKHSISKIVIDAGHGGKDSGCRGKYLMEKDLVLDIALQLGKLINENFPEIEVIYTRKTDVFVPLHERAAIANKNNADLFISIHINANASPRPYGVETFVMGLHKSEENLEVAKKENESILYEENYKNQYNGYDPNSPEAHIIFSLYQNIFLDQSLFLASKVQDNLVNDIGFNNRGIKQAGFLVLYKTTMPGILIEAGFLTNPEEEKLLSKPETISKIAHSVFSAFKNYRSEIEGITEEPKNTIISNSPNIENKTKTDTLKHDSIKELNQELDVFFSVQIGISKQIKPINSKEFAGANDIFYYIHDEIYKYASGKFETIAEAVNHQKELNKNGIKGAFVIAFKGNARISTDEALKLIDKK